jgi:regulator of cell morphogenesis and NO signaling
MTGNVVCVREDMSIEALAALLIERGISGVPVVDAAGFPVGVVSKTDLVREHYADGEAAIPEPLQVKEHRGIEFMLGASFGAAPAGRGTVGDIMTPLAFTLYEHSPISQAAALMAFEGVHRVPVVSNDGRVIGVLSALDVMRWLAQHDGYLVRDLAPAPERPRRKPADARPAMLSAEITVAEIVAEHSACAQIFVKHRIDFCCRGNVPVDAACRDRGLDTSAVLAELEAAIRTRGDERPFKPQAMATPALIEHIVATHHEYLRRTLPFLRKLAAKVRRVHGERNPRLAELDVAVEELAATLLPHLDMEERALFPLLIHEPGSPRVAAELATMHEDHLVVGAQLARIHEAAEGFRAPAWACNSYRTLFAELEHLAADIFEHVHIENHVLMPRFTAAAALA